MIIHVMITMLKIVIMLNAQHATRDIIKNSALIVLFL